MAPKGPKNVNQGNAIKVAAWDAHAEKQEKAKKRPTSTPLNPAQLQNALGALGRPHSPLAPTHGYPYSPSTPPPAGVGHLSPLKSPDQEKADEVMRTAAAAAHHALDDLEGGSPDHRHRADPGYLDTPEKSGLWERLKPKPE